MQYNTICTYTIFFINTVHSFSPSAVLQLLQDFKPLPGHSNSDLLVPNATKDSEGVYTCVCTWKYNQRQCTSSASRRLKLHGEIASHHL